MSAIHDTIGRIRLDSGRTAVEYLSWAMQCVLDHADYDRNDLPELAGRAIAHALNWAQRSIDEGADPHTVRAMLSLAVSAGGCA